MDNRRFDPAQQRAIRSRQQLNVVMFVVIGLFFLVMIPGAFGAYRGAAGVVVPAVLFVILIVAIPVLGILIGNMEIKNDATLYGRPQHDLYPDAKNLEDIVCEDHRDYMQCARDLAEKQQEKKK